MFRPEWMRDFRAADFDRSTAEVRVAVDPSATAKETSDYKASSSWRGRPARASLYCLHAWLRRASPNELIAEILRVHDDSRPAGSAARRTDSRRSSGPCSKRMRKSAGG